MDLKDLSWATPAARAVLAALDLGEACEEEGEGSTMCQTKESYLDSCPMALLLQEALSRGLMLKIPQKDILDTLDSRGGLFNLSLSTSLPTRDISSLEISCLKAASSEGQVVESFFISKSLLGTYEELVVRLSDHIPRLPNPDGDGIALDALCDPTYLLFRKQSPRFGALFDLEDYWFKRAISEVDNDLLMETVERRTVLSEITEEDLYGVLKARGTICRATALEVESQRSWFRILWSLPIKKSAYFSDSGDSVFLEVSVTLVLPSTHDRLYGSGMKPVLPEFLDGYSDVKQIGFPSPIRQVKKSTNNKRLRSQSLGLSRSAELMESLSKQMDHAGSSMREFSKAMDALRQTSDSIERSLMVPSSFFR